jgi:DNA-binding response OmpR family regulator
MSKETQIEHILHVDEEDETQEFIRQIFEKIDVAVDSTYDYEQAQKLLQNEGFKKYTGLVLSANLYEPQGKNGLDIARYALSQGFDADRYPIIIVAPKKDLKELRTQKEVREGKIICLPEYKETEAPEINEIIALYCSRRGL